MDICYNQSFLFETEHLCVLKTENILQFEDVDFILKSKYCKQSPKFQYIYINMQAQQTHTVHLSQQPGTNITIPSNNNQQINNLGLTTQENKSVHPDSDKKIEELNKSGNKGLKKQQKKEQSNEASSSAKQKIEGQIVDQKQTEKKNIHATSDQQQIKTEKSDIKSEKKLQKLKDIQLELLDMGFQKYLIQQALKITEDKDKAIEYIITSIENEQTLKTQKTKPKPKAGHKMMEQEKKILNQNQVQDSDEFQDVEEQYKMIFLVRMDLKMGLGKIAAQVAHATLKAYKQMVQRANYNDLDFVALEDWKEVGQKKIVVKVNDQKQLMTTLKKATERGLNNCYIRDAGLTQIASGSVTVGAIGPAPSSQIDQLTKSFKLL